MKISFEKIVCLLCIAILLINCFGFAFATSSDDSNVIGVDYDTTIEKHQAFTMTVGSTASDSSVQAFCIGWTFVFTNADGSMSTKVYVDLANVDKGGVGRTYYMPISPDYIGTNDIKDGLSIFDNATYQYTLSRIMKSGGTVEANARIQKFSYSAGVYTGLNVYANSVTELNSKFSEFSPTFLSTTAKDYFNWSRVLDKEQIVKPTPSVILNLPADGSTVTQGTTVTFSGTGTGVHHIAGFVDNNYIGTQDNPNTDLTTQMTYSTSVTLNEVRDYKFQIKGRNGLDTDSTTTLAESAIHTVHVVAPPPNTGTITVTCLDYATNAVISTSNITGVPYGTPRSVTKDTLSGYNFEGSFSTNTSTKPAKTSSQAGVSSQSVTLSSSQNTAYVWFWYSAIPVEAPNEAPVAIINNTYITYAGDDVYVSGAASYDPDGVIKNYYWSMPGAGQSLPDTPVGYTWYPAEGTYNIDLVVVDDDGLAGVANSSVTIQKPLPTVNINVSAANMKENRKITLDVSSSTSSSRFPISWDLTTWTIEPVFGSGATGDYGVRLADGRVYKNVGGIAYQNNSGTWINTGTAFTSVLVGQKKIDFQARDFGQYKVTANLTNMASFNNSIHYTNLNTKTLYVTEDLAPTVDYSAPATTLRDKISPNGPTAQKYGITPVTSNVLSPDGDPIVKRIWTLRYDSDNDGSFADETDIYPYSGNEPFASGWRIVVNGDNDPIAEVWSYDVGLYAESLTVYEDIPDAETIKELLLLNDYRNSCAKYW